MMGMPPMRKHMRKHMEDNDGREGMQKWHQDGKPGNHDGNKPNQNDND